MYNLNKKINLLILDEGTPLPIFVVNCFSENTDVNIHILSSKKRVESRYSKYTNSFTYHKRIDDNDFFNKVKAEILSKKINTLLAVNVPLILFLSKHKEQLEQLNISVIVSSINSLQIADNKGKLAKYLKEFNISIPITYELNSINDFENLKYPLMIKPKTGWNGSKITKIENKEKYQEEVKKIISKEKYIIQDYIDGYDVDMSVLCKNGNILAYTIQKGFIKGLSTYAPPRGIEFLYNEELYKVVEKMMKNLEWSGIAHIDLRYDEIEKKFKVIEINPRFWGSIEASKMVGVNFPYLYCLTTLGIEYKIPKYRYEKYANNRGLIEIIKSKINFNQKAIDFPENTSIKRDLFDPMPRIFKYSTKLLNKISPKKI